MPKKKDAKEFDSIEDEEDASIPGSVPGSENNNNKKKKKKKGSSKGSKYSESDALGTSKGSKSKISKVGRTRLLLSPLFSLAGCAMCTCQCRRAFDFIS